MRVSLAVCVCMFAMSCQLVHGVPSVFLGMESIPNRDPAKGWRSRWWIDATPLSLSGLAKATRWHIQRSTVHVLVWETCKSSAHSMTHFKSMKWGFNSKNISTNVTTRDKASVQLYIHGKKGPLNKYTNHKSITAERAPPAVTVQSLTRQTSFVFKRGHPKRFTELISAVFGHRWNSFFHTLCVPGDIGAFQMRLWGTEWSFFEERTLWPFYPTVLHCLIGSEVSCCQSQSWSIDLIKQIWLLKLELSEVEDLQKQY